METKWITYRGIDSINEQRFRKAKKTQQLKQGMMQELLTGKPRFVATLDTKGK